MVTYFSETYEESRRTFRDSIEIVRNHWPDASLETYYTGKQSDNNTTDIIVADARKSHKNLIVLTAGEHGIEGFTGSAVINLFVHELLQDLNPDETGLRLVHGLNPWGMRHYRRVTENNVDLNRNYLSQPDEASRSENLPAVKEAVLYMPSAQIENLTDHNAKLESFLKDTFSKQDLADLKDTPAGQYTFKEGLFYGGQEMEKHAAVFKKKYLDWAERYEKICHLDIHSGGGPEKDLTLIFPGTEPREAEELSKKLNWPRVQKTPEGKVTGESTEFLQKKLQKEFPDKKNTACVFEFGTIGETLEDYVFCTRTMVNENLLYFCGTSEDNDRDRIKKDYFRLFYPDDSDWRQMVLEKGRKGIKALLKNENIKCD